MSMAAPDARALLWAWLPALLWAVLIWHLGTDDFSAAETSRILVPLIEWLLPDADVRTRLEVVAFIRKAAHPAVYGVLAGLAYRAATRSISTRTSGRVALAVAPVLLLAVADEWRQSTSPARTGAGWDVALDMAGGFAVVALATALERWLGRAPAPGRTDGPAPDAPGGSV